MGPCRKEASVTEYTGEYPNLALSAGAFRLEFITPLRYSLRYTFDKTLRRINF
jgi:hypothetical protein